MNKIKIHIETEEDISSVLSSFSNSSSTLLKDKKKCLEIKNKQDGETECATDTEMISLPIFESLHDFIGHCLKENVNTDLYVSVQRKDVTLYPYIWTVGEILNGSYTEKGDEKHYLILP